MRARRYQDEPEKKQRIDYVKCGIDDCNASVSIRSVNGEFDPSLLEAHHTQHARAKMYEKYGEDESLWPKPHEMILAVIGAIPKKRLEPVRETPRQETVVAPPPQPEKPKERVSGKALF